MHRVVKVLRQTVAFSLFLCSGLFAASSHAATEHLLLVGGGNLPPQASERFVSWAGGTQAKILLISWATEDAAGAYQDLVADFGPYHPSAFLWSKSPPVSPEEKAEFLATLDQATGVFFCGGDQQHIFDAFDHDRDLLEALRARYQAGVPFSGTSAGTAIMSSVAIVGGDPEAIDGTLVPTHEGLGLLPGVIVDQHFIRRSRENRLFGLVLLYPHLLGIGVDQDTSVAVEDGRWAEVIGPGDVMMVDAQRLPGSLVVTLLKPGAQIDLHSKELQAR